MMMIPRMMMMSMMMLAVCHGAIHQCYESDGELICLGAKSQDLVDDVSHPDIVRKTTSTISTLSPSMTSTTTILKTTSTRSSMSQSTDLKTTSSGSSTTSTEESRTMATTETATSSTTDNGTGEATAIISTLGNAAVEVEPVPEGKTEGKMKTFTSHISVRPTFLLQVLDTTSGSPAKSLPVTLYEQTTKKGWEAVEEGCTLDDGHMKLLKGRSLNPRGRYKLHLDTGHYFSQKGGQPMCPFIELGLQTPPDCQNLHVSVHIGLNGYATYFGT